jgi:hypothetical protein
LTALVVRLVLSIPMWLMPPHVDGAEFRFPIGRWLLGTLVDVPWHGAFLGLGLVVLDRVAGNWRRPLRWAVAGVLFPGLLAAFVLEPAEWRYVYGTVRANGLVQAVGLIRPWQSWLWLLVGAGYSGLWAWWVGRAVVGPERLMMLSVARWQSLSWTEVWANSAFGLVSAGLRGALNGLAIAVALWATRPREPEAMPVDEA